MNGSTDSTGGVTADSCRAERVAHLGRAITNIYSAANSLDEKDWEKASLCLQAAIQDLEAAGASGEGERRCQEVHGDDQKKAQMSFPDDMDGVGS